MAALKAERACFSASLTHNARLFKYLQTLKQDIDQAMKHNPEHLRAITFFSCLKLWSQMWRENN
jgi:hypothetical protein